ncbi:MAG: fumarate hydratase [Leptospiraceae bacterium]|nr:fumarate hydratase [Leptospiraceae bacterium]MCP5498929.1 fumarate hydratase [Leptospiraceae bacterium]
MPDFFYSKPFPLGDDKTEYKLLTKDYIKTVPFGDKEILSIEPEGLTYLAEQAMNDVSFFLRTSHLEKVRKILDDTEATENDKFVALALLKNSTIAAEMQLPTCQDTGTGIIVAKKGDYVITGADDAEALSRGIFKTYTGKNLRYSQVVPYSMYEEANSGCNLPAQVDIYSTPGDKYEFLFLAKGGGSANKTYLYQETKALLNPASLEKFIIDKMKSLGTAACPPYHIAVVIGGTSAETNLKTVKLASTGYLDALPAKGGKEGFAFRDFELEEKMLKAARESGIGAQFGGKYLAHDFKIIRLPRHGASCPVGIGVSCSADRNIKAKITKEGIFLEKLEVNPGRFLPSEIKKEMEAEVVQVDLNQPMKDILALLSKYPVKTRVMLSGRLVVARDIAHAKLKEKLDKGEALPDYFKNHPIYYAGPAKTPEGMPSGSFGPTTAGRMDSYVPIFQEKGYSMITLAKGNRSSVVTDSCKKNGGFYLGSIGGPAALLAKENIKKVEVLDYPELGMEAIWAIDVENFPAFIIVDDKGNDFFQML